MIDLGEFNPGGAIGPTQETDATGQSTGVTKTGRLTTTVEQAREAVGWILRKIEAKPGQTEASAVVNWTRGEPSVLVVSASIEHIAGRPLAFVRQVEERTLEGAVIPSNPASRSRRLIAEVSEMSNKGQL